MRRHTPFWLIAALVSAGAVPAYIGSQPRSDGDTRRRSAQALSDDSGGQDWAGYGRTYGEQHFSPLDQINTATVSRLALAWSLDLPTRNSVSQPLEIGGVLYFATGNSFVHAVDAQTGKELWVYDSGANAAAGERMRVSWGSRGIGYWNGKVYTGTVDGRLIAIDGRTGKAVWSVQTLPEGSLGFITGAPRLFDGKVIIGQGGSDTSNLRGFVSTYDAETGKLLWRFHTVPGDPAKGFEDDAQKMAAQTWSGSWWKYGGGGNVWNAFAYDKDTDTILLGTGNGAPWNHRLRSEGKGDNLFLCSIVALDARTGRYRWHYQVNPGESWDYNASMDMHLADLTIDGKVRKVLVTAPKNGFLYVIDRTNGRLVSAEPYTKVTWADRIDLRTGRPVERPGIRYPDGGSVEIWPSSAGAHAATPSAFSPSTGLIYIPMLRQGSIYSDAGIAKLDWARRPHNGFDPGVNLRNVDAGDGARSALVAIDPVTQKTRWSVALPGLYNGGVLATAGRLVFQGRAAGTFDAYDAERGTRLWSFAAQAGVMAPPISYALDGKQYVTVLTGTGLGPSMKADELSGAHDYRTQARRVLTFVLDGKATIPSSTPFVATAPDDPGYKPDPVAAGRGGILFYRCGVCHGVGAVAAGMAPDLRTSAVPQDIDALRAVVRDGALVPQGMPRFAELTERDLADLMAYLRSRAADLRNETAKR